jgi:hypothetical protein
VGASPQQPGPRFHSDQAVQYDMSLQTERHTCGDVKIGSVKKDCYKIYIHIYIYLYLSIYLSIYLHTGIIQQICDLLTTHTKDT